MNLIGGWTIVDQTSRPTRGPQRVYSDYVHILLGVHREYRVIVLSETSTFIVTLDVRRKPYLWSVCIDSTCICTWALSKHGSWSWRSTPCIQVNKYIVGWVDRGTTHESSGCGDQMVPGSALQTFPLSNPPTYSTVVYLCFSHWVTVSSEPSSFSSLKHSVPVSGLLAWCIVVPYIFASWQSKPHIPSCVRGKGDTNHHAFTWDCRLTPTTYPEVAKMTIWNSTKKVETLISPVLLGFGTTPDWILG